jgi:hypothetical protein
MSGPIIRSRPSRSYATNWAQAFKARKTGQASAGAKPAATANKTPSRRKKG